MSKWIFRTSALSASCGPSPPFTRVGASAAGLGVDVADGCSHDGPFLPGGPDSAEALGCSHDGLFLPRVLGSAEALGCSHGGGS